MLPRDFKQGLSPSTLSVPETAARLHLSIAAVRGLLQQGHLHGFRITRTRVRIYASSVAQYRQAPGCASLRTPTKTGAQKRRRLTAQTGPSSGELPQTSHMEGRP